MKKISYRTNRTGIISTAMSGISLLVAFCATGIALHQNELVQRYEKTATKRDQFLAAHRCYPTERIAQVSDHLLNPFIGERLKASPTPYYARDIKNFEHQLGIDHRGYFSEYNINITPSVLGN